MKTNSLFVVRPASEPPKKFGNYITIVKVKGEDSLTYHPSEWNQYDTIANEWTRPSGEVVQWLEPLFELPNIVSEAAVCLAAQYGYAYRLNLHKNFLDETAVPTGNVLQWWRNFNTEPTREYTSGELIDLLKGGNILYKDHHGDSNYREWLFFDEGYLEARGWASAVRDVDYRLTEILISPTTWKVHGPIGEYPYPWSVNPQKSDK
jgi:hypothetical protein